MPDEKPDDYAAELLILEDMGVAKDAIERINSKPAADKLIQYYENKAPKKEEIEEKDPKKPLLKLNANMGSLPDPEQLTDEIRLNLREALNSRSPKRAVNNRWNKKARILMHYNEETGNMEVF